MCIIQHIQSRKVFTFEPKNVLVSLTISSAKPALTCLIPHFLDRKPTNILFGGNVTTCFSRKRSCDYKKTISTSEEIYPPITIKHTSTCAKKGKNRSIYCIIGLTPHPFLQLHTIFSILLLYTSSLHLSNLIISDSALSGLSPVDHFSHTDCERSRPRKDNMFPRTSSGSLKLVIVSQT